ncbi:TPA: hypothetical protein N0F65_011342 [Lagenidium giganteum]|uniref:Peptidase M1 leukotriene A4 hydrolase/aminopeptidase C-terminal domain-containing protein n=1 Tax=Lagenidium giganteum TaxID=4803 RepID=A0AAV2Z2K4_9STRA|nr:TPA: hypothetical protein N0F65_011342 [Lagenidium giganteum]
MDTTIADPATCAAIHAFDLHHVHLDMDVHMQSKSIASRATLHVRRLGADSPSRLTLDVFKLVIQSVYVEYDSECVEATWAVEPFTVFGERLEIDLPPAMTATAFRVSVQYTIGDDSPGVCWLEKEQTAGKKYPYMYTQGQEVLNRSFFPCQDSPSVRLTYSAAISVPSELVCVMSAKRCASGPKKTEEGHDNAWTTFEFEMKQSIPVYLVAMAVGDLVSAQVGPRSSIWTEPCMLEASKYEFNGILEKFIAIGERLFGEYLWEQYDLLVMPPSFPYGGMENPRLTFVSPCIIAGDQSLCSVVAHEISHSWFGNLVTNATWSDFFLNEGFTMYAERQITEQEEGRALTCLDAKVGEALLRHEISSLGEDSPLTRLRVPLEQGIDPGDCYNQCAYEKGYAFVCYLRHLVGSDETFNAFLKSYCNHFKFQSIPAEKMMEYFLSYFPHLADGNELKGPIKFSTWLHAPGYPPFTPDLSAAQDLMDACESLAFNWTKSDSPVQADVLYLSVEAMKWPVTQLLHFLDCCIEASFSSPDVVVALGDALNLWTTNNTEVMFRFSQIIIKNVVESKLDFVTRFMTMQGKQKFQVPMYRLMTSSSSAVIHQFARDTHEVSRSFLHVMVRDRVEALLNSMEK